MKIYPAFLILLSVSHAFALWATASQCVVSFSTNADPIQKGQLESTLRQRGYIIIGPGGSADYSLDLQYGIKLLGGKCPRAEVGERASCSVSVKLSSNSSPELFQKTEKSEGCINAFESDSKICPNIVDQAISFLPSCQAKEEPELIPGFRPVHEEVASESVIKTAPDGAFGYYSKEATLPKLRYKFAFDPITKTQFIEAFDSVRKSIVWRSPAIETDSAQVAEYQGLTLISASFAPVDGVYRPLRAFQTETGQNVWSAKGVGGKFLISDRAIFIQSEMTLKAISAQSGKTVWQDWDGKPNVRYTHTRSLHLENGVLLIDSITYGEFSDAECTLSKINAVDGTLHSRNAKIRCLTTPQDPWPKDQPDTQVDLCERLPFSKQIVNVTGAANCHFVSQKRMQELTELDLSGTFLTLLNENFFDGFNSLESLDLSENRITAVPAHAFRKLRWLKRLRLSANPITGLSSDAFQGLPHLEELYLTSNQLSELPSGLFLNLPRLRRIHLGSNKLSQFSLDLFKDLGALKELFLYRNPLSPEFCKELQNLPHSVQVIFGESSSCQKSLNE